jgi:hypothetical protein
VPCVILFSLIQLLDCDFYLLPNINHYINIQEPKLPCIFCHVTVTSYYFSSQLLALRFWLSGCSLVALAATASIFARCPAARTLAASS